MDIFFAGNGKPLVLSWLLVACLFCWVGLIWTEVKRSYSRGASGSHLVILATQEAEIRRIAV
jgi:hypothetical protein